jgi:HEAT repeat protein
LTATALNDPDANVRGEAVAALCKIVGDAKAAKIVAEVLSRTVSNSTEYERYNHALEALIQITRRDRRTPVAGALRQVIATDKTLTQLVDHVAYDVGFAKEVIQLLCAMDVPFLEKLVEVRRQVGRKKANEILERFKAAGWKPRDPLQAALCSIMDGEYTKAAEQGPVAFDGLMSELARGGQGPTELETYQRSSLIEAIGTLRDERAVDQLAGELWAHHAFFCREAAARALAEIAAPSCFEPLMRAIRLCKHEDEQLYSFPNLARAIARIPHSQVAAELLRLAEDPRIAEICVEAIGCALDAHPGTIPVAVLQQLAALQNLEQSVFVDHRDYGLVEVGKREADCSNIRKKALRVLSERNTKGCGSHCSDTGDVFPTETGGGQPTG